MFVCVCRAVTDHQIRNAAQTGTCCTLKDLRREFGVSSECGQCAASALACLKEAQCEQKAAA